MACVAIVFMAAPWPTLAVFLALSVWHFGWSHAGDDDPATPGGIIRVASALAHGGMVLGTPLIAWPAETTDQVTRLLALTHRGHPPFEAARGAVLTTGLVIGAIGLVSLGVEVLLTCRRDAAGRRLARLALETGVFAALGWWTTPLFSVGLSFLAWHGWRQMADLCESVVGVRPRSWPRLAHALARLHAGAIPLLVPTWIVIGAAWWMVPERHTATDLAILSIAAYVVVTPAHELLGHLVRPRIGRAPSDPLGRHFVATAAVVQRPSTARHAPVGFALWSRLGSRSGRTAS
jgi:Brp/Blh family beta-carotene 15,15'-monooxygenase